MTLKSLLWRKKYVMTSKIRHDVKKFLMMLKHVNIRSPGPSLKTTVGFPIGAVNRQFLVTGMHS